jgi:valyl-tRNA synthetase
MPEMPKAYVFSGTEERLYQWWEEHGWFKPEARPADAKPFVISIPPPNVTGELHMGHVMFVALEDLMIRRARMQGRAALWVPGVDHAGIATQLQVEKMLLRREATRPRNRPRAIFAIYLGMERKVWQLHHRTTASVGRKLRLGPRALYAGRRVVAKRCAKRLCACTAWGSSTRPNIW